MRLPDALHAALLDATSRVPYADMRRAAAEISRLYSSDESKVNVLRTEAHRAAYLLTRLPATYAASHHVLGELAARVGEARIDSILDIGAGPGTAAWAATEIFPSLRTLTLLERDQAMSGIGRELFAQHPNARSLSAHWKLGDANQSMNECQPHDLVVAAYMMGELELLAMASALQKAWRSTKQFLCIIEPGTPRGFQTILKLRASLLEAGGRMVAPCPHAEACPLRDSPDDWCHFSQRLERSSEHRRLKDGALSYEDEKFSYVIASRTPIEPAKARIIRHPRFMKGHVKLTLCTPQGIEARTVTKSQKENYKRARRSEWGDEWSEENK